ncbi:MAG: beta-lactamase family protein [Gemmatimonadota bacterium]|nr:beta-lactamase family protein [Gemmatimonadota bacterium]
MNRREWIGSTTALGALGCAGLRHQAPDPGETMQRDPVVDLPRILRIASVPGTAVAIVNGDSFTVRGSGTTRAQDGEQVTENTIFEAASLSKPVFAYLVHRLVTEGKLDLDRPLGDYIPLPNPSDTLARTITARHVLSHTSGWRNWRFNRDQQLTADFAPGSRWSYSGEGYYFLQRIVEHVTGQGILRLTQDRIFDPLGMRRSSYMWRADLDANRASPHSNRGVPRDSNSVLLGRDFVAALAREGRNVTDWRHEDAERVLSTVRKDSAVLPNTLLPNVAASLLTTARDYGIFLRHLWGNVLLERMTTRAIQINEALAWGPGVGLETPGATGQMSFWHWGDNPGFKHFVVGDAGTRHAVVVFTNGDNGRAVYERVVRNVRGDEPAFLAL